MNSDMKNNEKKIIENDFDEIESEYETKVDDRDSNRDGFYSKQKSEFKILAEEDNDESNSNNQINKQSNKKKIIIVSISVIAILLISLLGFFISVNSILNYKKIYTGISAGGIDLSGKTAEQAKELLTETYVTKFKECSMNIKGVEGSKIFLMSDFTESPDVNRIVDDAYKIGRSEGGAFKRYKVISQLRKKPVKIEMSTQINKEKIISSAQEIYDSLFVPAVNHTYKIMPLTLTLTAGHSGIDVNKDKLIEDMTNAIKNLKTGDIIVSTSVSKISGLNFDEIFTLTNVAPIDATVILKDAKTIEITESAEGKGVDEALLRQSINDINSGIISFKSLEISIKPPMIDKKSMESKIFRENLSESSLVLSGQDSSRDSNIKLAISMINQLILMPGEEFDFNSKVGELTVLRGYKEAVVYPELLNEKVLGGGVNEVASVLFFSALSSNLDITERHNNEYAVNPDLLGIDSSVKYGSKNLRFKNNTPYPIKIKLQYSNSKIVANIIGTNESSYKKIEVKTKKISQTDYDVKYKYDSALPENTETISVKGLNGYEYETMVLIDNSEKANSKFKSTYVKRDEVILTSEQNP